MDAINSAVDYWVRFMGFVFYAYANNHTRPPSVVAHWWNVIPGIAVTALLTWMVIVFLRNDELKLVSFFPLMLAMCSAYCVGNDMSIYLRYG